ncbi:MAG: DUF2089 domain-containing protein [Elusimicrobiales bacterium]|nr:DUF2089 domain-containing protein [Elusimicrobiales bacterium]
MNIPNKCPSCEGKLFVTQMSCSECETTIKGQYELPQTAYLNSEDENFLKIFLAARGSIKEMEKRLGISYPTVKSRLELLLKKLGLKVFNVDIKKKRLDILEKLEAGELSSGDAIKKIKELEDLI